MTSDELLLDRINTQIAGSTIFGWFAGLIWDYFARGPALDWPGAILLVVGGMFGASLLIAFPVALALMLTARMLGAAHLRFHALAWGVFIAPVLAFFATVPVTRALLTIGL